MDYQLLEQLDNLGQNKLTPRTWTVSLEHTESYPLSIVIAYIRRVCYVLCPQYSTPWLEKNTTADDKCRK